MTSENTGSGGRIVAKTTVIIKSSPPEPDVDFLSKRVNTLMDYCGDIENIVVDGATAKLVMALGKLSVWLDESVRHPLLATPEAWLHKNVCVKGYLTAVEGGFQLFIEHSEHLLLTGH